MGRPWVEGKNVTIAKVKKNMVGTRRLELLTSTVSKSGYSATQQLTGYPGLPSSSEIRNRLPQKRNECGTRRYPKEVTEPRGVSSLGYETNRINDSITFQRLDTAGNDK